MANITSSMVKELREKTGAGMMDCKKALEQTGGDLEAAVDELRKRGQAIAEKRGGRAMKEGLIAARVQDGVAAMIEVNCETDFVARNDDFKSLTADLLDFIFQGGPAIASGAMDQVAQAPVPARGGKPLADVIQDAIAKTGENTAFSRFVRFESSGGYLTAYIHPPGKLGVLLELASEKPATQAEEGFQTLARDLAMHVAAAAPVALSREDIPETLVARERAVYAESDELKSKPANIKDKIIDGKMAKFFKQSVLTEQEFVKDPDLTIGKLVEQVGKQLGDSIRIARFTRFVVGEGGEE